MRRLIFALAFVLAGAFEVPAQDASPAFLIADSINVTNEQVLVATGNVEVLQGTQRMRAQAVTYDQNTDRLIVSGPIIIDEGPNSTILASQADMSPDLNDGILKGARVVLNQHLQIASPEIQRREGRYTQFYRAAASSCRVCENDPRPPLWQIRAQRVVHAQDERQIYFYNAQLRVRDVPIIYLPRLRMPDPTLDRATGFLRPTLENNSQLGTGIKTPYFIRIGDHKDLTLTPYLASSTRTLEFRYRQAFARGRINLEGALSRDDLREGTTRAYLFGDGKFELNRGFGLRFNVRASSDQEYLRDYNYSFANRLRSDVQIDRTRRDQYLGVVATQYSNLRPNEDNATLPRRVFEGFYEQRYHPTSLGGEFRLSAEAQAYFRESSLAIDGPDADDTIDGRDVTRLTFGADWRRNWVFGGLETKTTLGVASDMFVISDDATFDSNDSELTPYAALELRFPMTRGTASGATQLLEPFAQFSWIGGDDLDVPNEQSLFVEFDEGNLLSFSRYPATDRRERGTAAAFGLNWGHFGQNGSEATLTLGQIIRSSAEPDFSNSSGLSGTKSDYLVSGLLRSPNGLRLQARGLFDQSVSVSRSEIRGGLFKDGYSLSGAYVFLDADPDEDRTDRISELNLNTTFDVNQHWNASAFYRYDLDQSRGSIASLGMKYLNECVEMNVNVERRFTSPTRTESQTTFGLTLQLRGFSSATGTAKHVRACKDNNT